MLKCLRNRMIAGIILLGGTSIGHGQIPVTDALSAGQRAQEFAMEAQRWIRTVDYHRRQVENFQRSVRNLNNMRFSDVQRLMRDIERMERSITQFGTQSGRLLEKYGSFGTNESTDEVQSSMSIIESRDERSQAHIETIRGVAAQMDRTANSLQENAERQREAQTNASQSQGNMEILQSLTLMNSVLVDQMRDMQVVVSAQTALLMEQMAMEQEQKLQERETARRFYDVSDIVGYEAKSF